MRAFSLTSVQGIQSYLEVVLARQKLLQSSKVKDVPQHVSVGLHRVYDFHCAPPQIKNKTLSIIREREC